MGVMDMIFGKTNAQVAGSATVGQPGAPGAPNNPNVQLNPNDPRLTAVQRQQAATAQQGMNGLRPQDFTPPQGDSQQPGEQQKTSPLDAFDKLWDTPPVDKARPDKSFKYPKIDYNKVTEGVGKMDFTSGLSPETITKALGGDPQAFMDALNHVGRSSFTNSFQATDKYNSQLFSSYDESIGARIPKEVKNIQSSAALRQEMQSLDHPAVAPLLNKVREQMQQQYPDASPQELAEYSKKYMMTMAQLITSQSESDQNTGNRGSSQQQGRKPGSQTVTDFSDFLD